MARGWESKSIEAQQAEAAQKPNTLRVRVSAEDAALIRQKENLHLSRRRVVQQMEATTNTRHRKLLEGALAELDAKLKEFGA